MDFLNVKNKTFLITGVANRKSIAYFCAKILEENGAHLIFSVQHEKAYAQVEKLFPSCDIYLIDVENEEQVKQVGQKFIEKGISLDGLLHSMAFANLSNPVPFHETSWENYQQAEKISCFSLILLANAFKESLTEKASVVTLSISNTRATNYGYLGPIKASLDAAVSYLAKSFSSFSKVRFNAVCAGPLKTSASAGIPGYIDNYLFAEKLTMRKQALATDEVAKTAVFLLSPAASGVNAANIVVDAGMSSNYFEEEIVRCVSQNL
jgi:enoyl-[acyl-carrier protein] reductase I